MANQSQTIKFTKLFINNEFVAAQSGRTFVTVNPATGKKLADIAEGDKADVDLAVKAAKKAFALGSEWRSMDSAARGKLLWKLADLFERDTSILANLETLDNGKTFEDSVFDIGCAIDTLRYYAGAADKFYGDTIPCSGPYMSFTRREPMGVCGQIIPWNYPLLMFSWKLGPVIATGCVTIIKPAEQTPLTALYAASLIKEAGFPAGVVNVVPGYGPTAGQAISMHPEIRKVAFTGSVEVGKLIMEASAKTNLKKVTLELGGKSPMVIFNDVDIDEAVEVAHNAIFANHGQNCCAGSRTFVQEGIYDAFVKKAALMASKRKVGDPWTKGVMQGPQVDEESMTKVLAYVDSAVKEGAKLEFGGKRIGTTGYFVEPTVFSSVTDTMRIAREEIFGPVQSILKFKTLEEVIERANNTNFGLAAGVMTKDLNNAMTFARTVEAGSVWVNCYDIVQPQAPFGGYKMSGFGRELGKDGLEPYLETKTVYVKTPALN